MEQFELFIQSIEQENLFLEMLQPSFCSISRRNYQLTDKLEHSNPIFTYENEQPQFQDNNNKNKNNTNVIIIITILSSMCCVEPPFTRGTSENFKMVTSRQNARQNKRTNQNIIKKKNENEEEKQIFDLEKHSKMEQIALFN